MPISRFLDDLLRSGEYDRYMHKLIEAFNPAAADSVMCRRMISVDWKGRLFDCDFNQMLDLPVVSTSSQTIHDFDLSHLANRRIATGRHCFGCTAGAGSSCQGSVLA
jgi:radical SAM/Cys-rich protein